ncbi:uncharacterized protein LOC105167716 isoform X2 [Sesamum indicum]|uniref:Uncharacterized protein LOC105167716 isoform X2 n=1 Tax=Sesamum indicum TaxID=4182 RepID=A0A6I9TJA1_SESIN|nr:uncharacterized protein LOC105167716 isoform X2 [Sesamum indicum]
MAQSEINLENGAEKTVWSEEYERVPLKQRLKLLLASHRVSVDSELKSERQIPVLPPNVGVAAAEKRENGHCDIQSGCSAEEQVIETVERHAGELGDSNHHENLSLKVECAGNCVESPSATYLNGSILAGSQTVISEHEMGDESLDELDHVVLKERLKRLLTSKCLGSASTKAEENSAAVVKGELLFGDQRHVPGNQIHDIDRTSISSSKDTVNLSCKPSEALGQFSGGNRSTCPDSLGIWRNDMGCSSEKEFFKHKSGGKTLLSGAVRTVQGSAISNLAMIKIEPPNYDEFQSSNVTTPGQMSFRNLVPVKTEVQVAGNADEDELDHMLLRERMKLLSSSDGPSLDIHQGSECFSKMIPSALGCRPVASKPSLSLKVNCPRKRRKTVTDSIETAMEEDAPGLLQVLIDKGVSVNEIKLYGEPESNDALDDSSTNDNFAELEVVISKLFSQRASLLKFSPLRCARGEKASYCLECLFSLVEQARYLQFRNWPVEWGWCRDLQSFIFVFERHNRIVLERPEYGYATYFFELADSLPIDWQIKRLVIAMKLTSCSRVTLIENKALMVGDDLSNGEARVLMEYGWVPNTGLGTMLNYYDRVVHDRKTERSSEWRSKIGKLLMDGYNGGTIISAGIPGKVAEYNVAQPQEIKLELS